MTVRHRLSVVVIVGALTIAVLFGAWRLEFAPGDPLIVVGDSMSDLARDALVHEGDRVGYDVTVDGIPGVSLAQRMDRLQQLATLRSEDIVIELGTNDALEETPPSDLDALIDEAVSFLVNGRCVVFVNAGVLLGPVATAAHFNEHLRLAAAAHPNMHVFDWASEYRQHPDWTVDTVHLKPQYLDVYARAVITATRSSCRRQ